MSEKSVCAKAPKQQGERLLTLANELKIVDKKLEVERDENFIYVPLVGQPSERQLRILKGNVADLEVTTHIFPRRQEHRMPLVELLEDKLPPHLLASIPRSMDLVGDIAIIEVPPELDLHKHVIGEAILQADQNVRTVLAKAGVVSGTYRLRELNVIAGENRTETLHREYECVYNVDVAKAYFSPRLSYEHHRVASLVKQGETVVDLFAGVGPFAVQIAKSKENVKVYAIDVNPDAVEYLKKNIRLNRVEDKVYPILGDAKKVVTERLTGVADRVIMNLPEKALAFVDTACETLKPAGGTLHFYSFVNASDSLERVKASFIEAVEDHGRKTEKILSSRLVRATAPYEWQTVLDAEVH
jgi:tRNA (guanine37-N1)-methyltransferase